ncbi:VOC family protein [bacterium]|nr:VOC family protein [bacterium]
MAPPPGPGRIGWLDLTVPNAVEVRDFYQKVVGWTVDEVPMGDYSDFSMTAADGECVAGICHAQGSNASMPPAWIVYLMVEDLDASLASVAAGGGKVRVPERSAGGMGRFAVVEDPAGAVVALFEAAKT